MAAAVCPASETNDLLDTASQKFVEHKKSLNRSNKFLRFQLGAAEPAEAMQATRSMSAFLLPHLQPSESHLSCCGYTLILTGIRFICHLHVNIRLINLLRNRIRCETPRLDLLALLRENSFKRESINSISQAQSSQCPQSKHCLAPDCAHRLKPGFLSEYVGHAGWIDQVSRGLVSALLPRRSCKVAARQNNLTFALSHAQNFPAQTETVLEPRRAMASGGKAFVYGTLLADEVVKTLIHRIPPSRPAVLSGFSRYKVRGQLYPAVVPCKPESRVHGKVTARTMSS